MSKEKQLLIGIVMGSDSDLPEMAYAAKTLRELEVPYEVGVKSAHRTPDKMFKYGKAALGRLDAIIAGAGGAAHLPGMLAAIADPVPVYGVPIVNTPDGMNMAFGSMVGMPSGAPLSTMSKNRAGAENAALAAVQPLALNDPALLERYLARRRRMEQEVEAKDALMNEIGEEEYLERMQNGTLREKLDSYLI